MFKAIVTGTDGSSYADKAVRYAIGLAEPFAARVVIVRATPPLDPATLFTDSKAANAASQLDAYGTALEAEYPATALEWRAEKGDPADVLCRVAADEQAEVIVVGNRGMTGAKRFFLGSVPNRVAHQAGCAVLIVHTSNGEV